MFKTIASNTFAQLVAKFFGAGLTLVTTYYLIRLAGLELYGDLTKILVLVAVGFTAIDFGLNAEGVRSSHSAADMQKSLQTILLARLLLSCLIIVILNLIILFLPGGYSSEVKSTFWLGSLAIIFQGIYTSSNAYFQYHLAYWRATISVIVGSLLGAILTLYYLKYSPSLPHFVLATTLGYFSMALCSLLLLPRTQFENLRIWDLRLIFPLLRRSLILGAILIASVVASKIDTVILGVFRASSEVGEYGFAYRIFDVILVLPVFIMNAIYPLSFEHPHLIKRAAWGLAGLGALAAAMLWFAAPYVNLIKPELQLTSNILRLLSFSLPFFYLTAPLMWSLIAKGRDALVLWVYGSAALFNLALNLALIPSYGAPAAAINTGLTELLIFICLLYFSRDHLRI